MLQTAVHACAQNHVSICETYQYLMSWRICLSLFIFLLPLCGGFLAPIICGISCLALGCVSILFGSHLADCL